MSGWELLRDDEAAAARAVISAEARERDHLVVYLSGAHAYGFPSPDSDLDLKCIHVAPTDAVLGLRPPRLTADRCGLVGGVSVDYTSNEVGVALAGLLRGNGNFLERVLGPCGLFESPEVAALRQLVRRSLSRLVHRHYRGFALRQLEELRRDPSVKRLLYVFRTALTGTHLLLTAELVTDLGVLLPVYGPDSATELIAAKRQGERTPLDAATLAPFEAEVTRLLAGLDTARERSPLPEEPLGGPALEAWLVTLRRSRLDPGPR